MAAVNESSQAILAPESSPTASAVERLLMAVAVVLVLVGGIVGVVIAASMGESEAVFGIVLIAGGLLCAAALC